MIINLGNSPYGNITSAKVMRDENGSKGFGFVCFTSPEDAQKAIGELVGKPLFSKPLYVALAQRKEIRVAQLQTQYSNKQNKNYPYNQNQQMRGMPYQQNFNKNRWPRNQQNTNQSYNRNKKTNTNIQNNTQRVEVQPNQPNQLHFLNEPNLTPEAKKRRIGDLLYSNIHTYFRNNPSQVNDPGKVLFI